jgi:hypothetical protein
MKQNKNNLLTKLQTWVMLLVTVLLFGHTSKADIVYNNSVNRSTNGSGDALVFAQSGYEYGDEVALAGTARYLTNFAIEYYQNGIPAGATMRLRIYSNDGTAYGTNFNAPGSLLYDSSAFNVGGNSDGFHSLTFNQANSGLAIPVGGSFTWTVEFGGVTSGSAALSLYDAPTVGTDYNQYWEASGTTNSTAPWVYRLNPGLNINFGAIAAAADKSADVTAPTPVNIVTPANNAEVAGGSGTVTGNAKDGGTGKVSLVLVKVVGVGNYRPATLSTGTGGATNFSAPFQLAVSPANTLTVKAVDWAGNATTKSVNLAYTVSQPFTVTNLQDGVDSVAGGKIKVSGSGFTSVESPASRVHSLVIGRSYTIKASPFTHSILSNSILTVANVNTTTHARTNPEWSFTMNTNYGVVVNFGTNRYYRDFGSLAKGDNRKHYGLVGESFTDQANSGNIIVQISASDTKNAFSGKLTMNGDVEMSLAGTFDLNGDAVSLPASGPLGGGVYVVSVHLPFDSSDEITGTVSNSVSGVVSSFSADRDTWVSGSHESTAYAGRYVMAIPASAEGPTGYATWAFPIKLDGKVDTGDGFLADNNKVKAKTAPKMSKDGAWPMFVIDAQSTGQSRKSNGAYTASAIGWLQFNAGVGISGTAKIIRTATDNGSANFATGYTNVSAVTGEVWTDNGTAARTIALGAGGAGTATLSGGPIGSAQNIAVVSQADGKKITATLVGGVVPLSFKLEIAHDKGSSSSGAFTYSTVKQAITGVGLQSANRFYGHFQNVSGFPFNVGSVSVAP